MSFETAQRSSEISAKLSEAMRLLASAPPQAEAIAREALAAHPGDGDALTILGASLRLQGRFDEALSVLVPIASSASPSWIALYELGRSLFGSGRSREAVEPLTRAAALNPGLLPAWRLLGDIRLISGQTGPALAAYDRMARASLREPRAAAALDALIAGRPEPAARDLAAAFTAEPANLSVGYALGLILTRLGRLPEALDVLARLLDRAPDFDPAQAAMAVALHSAGRHLEALPRLDWAIARDPHDHRARMAKAAALSELGRFAEAAEVTEALLRDFPDQASAWLLFGNGLRTLGRGEAAIKAYRRCLALDPAASQAWWSLANLKTFRFSDADVQAIEAELARPGLPPECRIDLEFSLGKAREDAKAFAEAFEHYARGARLQHARNRYDPAATTALVARSKALFTQRFFAERKGWGVADADPIFILGLPRSGSTLVDQILASHPSIEGVRELQEIGQIVNWISGPQAPGQLSPYPDLLRDLPKQASAEFGRDYLEATRAYRQTGRRYFTDKAPWNFQHIGLIQLILPRAKIIDVRRHPLGCCFSAFKQHFMQGWEFSYDLEDLGRYYADYVELMAHFDAVLPGKVHRVIYEDLVADAEGETRRLLDYLGLPFDPACLKFFETARAVATPSSEQVRRPIFTDALEQWRNFEPWLAPLKAALGPVLDAYPAPPSRDPQRN